MSAKIFLNASIKYIPQMDMTIKYSDNQGIEGTQTFLARKADLGVGGNLSLFKRGTTWEQLFPEVPTLYRDLTMKTYDPDDHAPGIIAIKATFTGYQSGTGGGSSGEETVVGTGTFNGHLEETSVLLCEKARALSDEHRFSLAAVDRGEVVYLTTEAAEARGDSLGDGLYYSGDGGKRLPAAQQIYSSDGDAFVILKNLMRGNTTYKRPGGTWQYRTESKTGLKPAELAAIGKIVPNPPGEPPKPASGWKYFLSGATQTQSGPDRFAKDLNFDLIEDTEDNEFFYG